MARTWTLVKVDAPVELAEGIGSFLLDHGAPGLESQEHAGRVKLMAYFSGAAPLPALHRYCRELAQMFPDAALPDVRVETIDEESWAGNWKAHFSPLAVGERFFIHPPWVTAVPAGRLGLLVDPGMAFGTGHHESTRGCLHLMERAARQRLPSRVLDLGTGSGILAIAAAKLGAAEVCAVDVDPDACRIAAENAAINGVEARIRVAGSLEEVGGTFDLVLANLLANLLIELAPQIAGFVEHGGLAVGSGLLVAEAAGVRRAWLAHGLSPADEYEEEGWVSLAFGKP